MERKQEKSFCVLEFARCLSIIAVQSAFRRKYGKEPPCKQSILRWYCRFKDTGCLCKEENTGQPQLLSKLEINVEEENSEEFALEKVSTKSWNHMEKLEPGMTKNHEKICKNPNYSMNIENEIYETDDILLKDYRTKEASRDNDIFEQFLTKYENTVDNFCTKKEISEELIVKSEQCIIEDDEKMNVQGEQSFNNDVQLLSEDENNPGYSSSTKKDSRSTIDAQNQVKNLLENSQMNSDEQFKCSKCFEIFNSANDLEIHNHSQICQNKLEYSHSSVRHESTYNDKKYYECDVCKKTYTFKCNLTRHKLIHTSAEPYTCNVCNKNFMRKSHFTRHIRIHTGERPYSCDICEKRFIQKYELTVHQRSHTGEIPYVCDVCNKIFNTEDQLIDHTRIHAAEKPYSCDVCNMKFKTKYELVVHIRHHTGEKPYTYVTFVKTFSR